MSTTRRGTTRFSIRNNSRVAYDPGVEPNDGSTPIVLLHDLLADRSQYAELSASVAGARRLIIPEIRGHGASATLANQWYTVAEIAQDVVAVLELEQVPEARLIGIGLGGAVALELARQHQSRILSLVLIEPVLYGILDNVVDSFVAALRNERRTSDRAAADYSYKGLSAKALETFLTPRWGDTWRTRTDAPRQAAIQRHAAALSGVLPALDSYAFADADTRHISCPVLLLIGEDAPPIDKAVSNQLANRLPRVQSLEARLGDRVYGPLTNIGDPRLFANLVEFR